MTSNYDNTLSKKTLNQYQSIYNNLQNKIIFKDMNYIIQNPKDIIEKLYNHKYKNNKNYNVKTIKNYITGICSYIKLNNLNDKYKTEYKEYNDELIKLSQIIKSEYDEQKPPEHKIDSIITWDKFIKKRDELYKSKYASSEHLLLSMYSYIPPVRQDYGNIRIFYKEPSEKDLIYREDDKEIKIENYIILKNLYEGVLVLNDYKTKKIYKEYRTELPKELVEIIKDSIEKNDRDYLFINSLGKPYRDNFTKWSNRTLNKIFQKKNLSIGLLRKIFISQPSLRQSPTSIREPIAKKMLHSVQMADYNYAWINQPSK